MLLGILGASLLGNMLAGKGMNGGRDGSKDLQSNKEKWITRASYESKLDF